MDASFFYAGADLNVKNLVSLVYQKFGDCLPVDTTQPSKFTIAKHVVFITHLQEAKETISCI